MKKPFALSLAATLMVTVVSGAGADSLYLSSTRQIFKIGVGRPI